MSRFLARSWRKSVIAAGLRETVFSFARCLLAITQLSMLGSHVASGG